MANRKYIRFAFWFAFSFILNGYASGLPGISLGSLTFISIIFIAIFINRDKVVSDMRIIALFILLLALSIFDYSTVYYLGNPLVGIFKMFVWVFMINYVCPRYFRFDYVLKAFNIVSAILIIYLIVQIIGFNYLGIYFPNIFNIGPLKPYDANYADYARFSNASINRPGSFLSESSFCGNYLLITLIANLDYYKRQTKYNVFYNIFLSIGIILCTSTSALILLAFVWLMYINRCPMVVKYIVYIASAGLILYMASTNKSISIDDNTTLAYSLEKFDNLENSSRFGKSYRYLNDLTASEKLFGVGMGNETYALSNKVKTEEIYLNSVTSLLVQYGYLGAILFGTFIISILVSCIRARRRMSIVILVCYLVKGLASGIFFSTYGILFLVFVYADSVYCKYTLRLSDEHR